VSAQGDCSVGLISNPNSGHNRDLFDRFCSRVERCPTIHHIVTNAPADIPGALAELADRNIGVLAINGGDGTASAILGQLLAADSFNRLPVVALLPGGTANMNAGDIGIRGSLLSALETFCDWCEGDRTTEGLLARRALLRVELEGTAPPHHGMFLGGGAVIQGTEYAHREIHARGMRDDFSLALGVVRTVWGVLRDDPAFNRHVAIELCLDGGETRQHDTLILAISSLHRLAFGMRPFWGTDPGALRVTLMEQHCTKFLRTFTSIVRGKPNRNAVPESGYFSHNADQIRLSLQGKLNLDGEILDVAGPVTVSATPELEFLKL
jgi:diacylglycerol kinase family enzyme